MNDELLHDTGKRSEVECVRVAVVTFENDWPKIFRLLDSKKDASLNILPVWLSNAAFYLTDRRGRDAKSARNVNDPFAFAQGRLDVRNVLIIQLL